MISELWSLFDHNSQIISSELDGRRGPDESAADRCRRTGDPAQVRDVLALDAAAATVGTAWLCTDESGAGQLHKDALSRHEDAGQRLSLNDAWHTRSKPTGQIGPDSIWRGGRGARGRG